MKNQIIFFVHAGLVRDADRKAAANIHRETGVKVVFRNGTPRPNERPEQAVGVAGKVPPEYAGLPVYDAAGKCISEGAPAPIEDAGEARLNSIGLPEGSPETRDGLKDALTEAGVVFHGNAKLEKLADIYREHFFPSGE